MYWIEMYENFGSRLNANKAIFVLPRLLTACHIQIAGLLIEWEEREVHPTGADEGHSEMDKMLSLSIKARLREGF